MLINKFIFRNRKESAKFTRAYRRKVIAKNYSIFGNVLCDNSGPGEDTKYPVSLGSKIKETRIKKGLTRRTWLQLSGTSKTYISRIENNLIEPEFSILYKIVELELGKKLTVEIN